MDDFRTRTKIDGELALSLARTIIFPAVSKQLGRYGHDAGALQRAGLTAEVQQEMMTRINREFQEASQAANALEQILIDFDAQQVIMALQRLRRSVDKLEKLIDDDLWALPKYREMLFLY